MGRVRTGLRHPLTRQTMRYATVGVLVGLVNLGLPVLFNGELQIPIEIVIPFAYLTAATLHFNLQRHFVFRHVDEFALTTREQIMRYAAAGAIQYPAAALATAFLPGLLGVSQRTVFICAALAVSLTAFLVYRAHVFHAHSAIDARPGDRRSAIAVDGAAQPPRPMLPR